MAIAMYNGNEPYIFISYAHKNSDVVVPIIEALADNGFRVWYDADIEAGTEWPEYVAEKLVGSAVVIAFISKAALESQNCRREINFAISENKSVLSVYIEDVSLTPGMKMILGLTQAMFYNRLPYEAFLQKLMAATILAPCRCAIKSAVSAPRPIASPLSDFEIENGVLKKYVGKSTTVVIPDSVTRIGYCAFYGCSSLMSITIPDSVKVIGDGAFSHCSSLMSITIPNSVTSIGNCTFSVCSSMASITIPDSVKCVGACVFDECSNLIIYCETSCKPNGWNDSWNSDDCPVAWDWKTITDQKVRVTPLTTIAPKPVSSPLSDFEIENGVLIKYVGKSNLVAIPKGVTGIGDSAFEKCANLIMVTLPNSVTSIGYRAFNECLSLTNITIPDSVMSIDEEAFGGCLSLTSITIPDSVTSIDSAFSECLSLTNITIPNSVTSIDGAFSGCLSLTNITIPNSVTSIDGAFSRCLSLTNITIPNSVTRIGDCTFSGCSSLTSITIPNSVTRIGGETFLDCESLESIMIPKSVTSIGENAFEKCSSLTSITIPDSVTSIGEHAFYGCSSLTIYCEASSKPVGWADNWNPDNRPVVWGWKE